MQIIGTPYVYISLPPSPNAGSLERTAGGTMAGTPVTGRQRDELQCLVSYGELIMWRHGTERCSYKGIQQRLWIYITWNNFQAFKQFV